MPATCQLQALNQLSGQAIFQEEGQWFCLSIDDGWEPQPLVNFRDALRLTLHSNLVAEERDFSSRASLVGFIRHSWKQHAAIPDISVRRVLHLLPVTIQAAVAPSPRARPTPRPPDRDTAPAGTSALWELVLSIARSFAYRYFPTPQLAPEELASEVTFRLFKSRDRVEEVASRGELGLRRYVAGAVRNTILDWLRWSRPWRPPPPWPWPPLPAWGRAYFVSLERDPIPEEALIAPSSAEPPDVLERLAMQEAVQIALQRLRVRSPGTAAVVTARLFPEPGRTYPEIAAELGISFDAARNRYAQGIKVLRDILRDQGWDVP